MRQAPVQVPATADVRNGHVRWREGDYLHRRKIPVGAARISFEERVGERRSITFGGHTTTTVVFVGPSEVIEKIAVEADL